MKKVILAILGTLLLLGLLGLSAYYLYNRRTVSLTNQNGDSKRVSILIADTPELRMSGLSGYSSLKKNQGMLFVFDKLSTTPFWMKDMLFPLDMIFIDGNQKIVYIAKNAKPCENDKTCQVISSPYKYKYVLEVNSGFVEENSLRDGSKMNFNKFTFAP